MRAEGEDIKLRLEAESEDLKNESSFSNHDFARMNGVVNEAEESSLEPTVQFAPQPEEVITVKQIHQKPTAKAAVVGGSILVVFGIVGAMVSGTLSNINQTAPTKTKPQPAASTTSSDEESIGKLKTKNFLTSQSQELLALNKYRRVKANFAKPTPSPLVTTAPTAPPVARPIIVAQPPYQPVRAPIPRPVFTPVSEPSPGASSPPLQPTPTSTAIDPDQQWKLAASVGRYGGTSPGASNEGSTDSQDSTTQSDENRPESGQALAERPQAERPQAEQALARLRPKLQNNWEDQTASDSSNSKTVVIGTKATGELKTPIAWSDSLKNLNQKYILQLNEPLKAVDNSILVPKGAKIIARIIKADRAGLVQMSAVSVVFDPTNDPTNEKSLPNDSILILGKKGRPLQAKVTDKNNLGKDLRMALLRGVSNAADLVNQATSESTFNSEGEGVVRTSTNRRRNYGAGFLRGATEAVAEQMQGRSQQALQNVQSQPQVFALKQGTDVQIFVNQSFSF
jgi:hypothetical protein